MDNKNHDVMTQNTKKIKVPEKNISYNAKDAVERIVDTDITSGDIFDDIFKDEEYVKCEHDEKECLRTVRNDAYVDGNNKKKRKKKKFSVLSIIVTAAVVAVISVLAAVILGSLLDDTDNDKTDKPVSTDTEHTEERILDRELYAEEMRGVWIASVGNINFPSKKGLDEQQLKDELDAILEECSSIGFNTIFFQVRPSADALYRSEIFPWSEFISGTQGKAPDGGFDCLEYLLAKADNYGINIHAWVNPFRVTFGSASAPKHDVDMLFEEHPARKNPEYVIPYDDGRLYFDPGCPEVRDLVVSGIRELCENYPKLSGIHIDDYFYPYPVEGAEDFADDASYEKYGNGLERGNWRRNNVNLFVKAAYDTVKSIDKDMKFGVSPFGIWANEASDTPVKGSISNGMEAYSSLYCDALAWANGGYVDYIVPQDYWSFSTKAAPFDNIARWWNANLDGTGVELYIGHAAYRAGEFAENEIAIQTEFARSLLNCRGSVYYGFDDIKKNTAGVRDSIIKCFEADDVITVPVSDGAAPDISYPDGDMILMSSGYIFGTSDPASPLTINGEKISRTRDGYFSLYRSFSMGDNLFEMQYGGNTIVHNLKRVKSIPSDKPSGNGEMEKFEILSVMPDKPLWINPGDVVAITCEAPSGSKVYAEFGDIRVDLKPTKYSASTKKNYKETYKGSVSVCEIYAEKGEIADIGILTVYAKKDGKTVKKEMSEVKQIGEDVLIYAQVKNDYSYLKRTTVSSFYGDPLPQSPGMRDRITAFVNGYYKLGCGYYISKEDVDVVYDKALSDNVITSVNVNVNVKNTVNNLVNSTDICFEVLENVPVDIKKDGKKFTVTLYNSDTENIPDVTVGENPVIRSGKGYVGEDENLVYEFILKASENYYGYNIVNEDGKIFVKLHNPQTLAGGNKPFSEKTIVVDAGHGGDDIGAQGPSQIGSGLHEADLNLAIALELKEELEVRGAKVIMIREDDSTVTLEERIKILAGIIPDLMISVHHNSVDNSINPAKARGYLGLYSNDAGVMLANAVSDTVTSELSRYQRPTAYQALAVARNHRFPSTLCEMSFISHPEEFQWTVTEGNYARSAKAIADGVLEFYNRQAEYLEY